VTARVTRNANDTKGQKGATMADRYLDVKEVAERLGTTERFPRRLIEERRIAFVRVGRHVRIAESVLNAYIEANTVQPVTVGRVRRAA
jgi:excisionase family DNA binding protein